MAASRKHQEQVERARQLYCLGKGRDEIARALKVSKGTVTHWRNEDEAARKVTWDEERRRTRRPENVLRLLEERLARMVIEDAPSGPTDADAAKEYETRLLNMIKIIQGYRGTADDVSLCMHALEKFAEFCGAHIESTQLAAVRAAVELFTDYLRGRGV